MTEHCYLHVGTWIIEGDERKKRGWKKDGIQTGVNQTTELNRAFHELAAIEGVIYLPNWRPTWEVRQAFLGVLNRLSADGWRVVQSTTVASGHYQDRNNVDHWPLGDWLLVREVTPPS